MCGRYSNTRGPGEIGSHFGLRIGTDDGTRRYNIAPTEQVLAIVAPKGEREARLLRWGLVPSYATDLKSSYKMINARMESVTTNVAYRRLIPRAARRALQVADGYYEWLKPERRGEPRQPFFFQVDGGAPFAFAALWTPAKLSTGEWVQSVALLTCDPDGNDVARAIHNRMPVILADADAQRAWLDPSLGAEDALAWCGPVAAERLSARPVNPAVNRVDPDHEGPELLEAPTP
jgi:putative SOS response-associated peptidase YedK